MAFPGAGGFSWNLGFLSNVYFQLFSLIAIVFFAGILFLMTRRGSANRGTNGVEGGMIRTMLLFVAMIYVVFAVILLLLLLVNWVLPYYIPDIPSSISFNNAIFAFVVFNIVVFFVGASFYGRLRGRRL